MALMSDVVVPLEALRSQIASAIDIIVQTSRMPDGSRCVTHVTEVLGYDRHQGYRLSDLFLRTHVDGGRSRLTATGRLPSDRSSIEAVGLRLPSGLQSESCPDVG